jgi:carbazole 1,9a-dioxygenase terminal dioxygenase component
VDGPKGVYDDFSDHIPTWEGVIDGQVAVRGIRAPVQQPSAAAGTSMWLPCVLKVDTFPVPGITQFEWYVPIDAGSHIYVQTLGTRVKTEEDRRRFAAEFESKWKPVALRGFNDDDIWAREATEPFYADDWGWIDETLCEPDNTIVAWRKLASRHNRGIQRPEHLR